MITLIMIIKITKAGPGFDYGTSSNAGLLRTPMSVRTEMVRSLPQPNFFLSNPLATFGSAFPFEAFITSPIKKPIRPFLPLR